MADSSHAPWVLRGTIEGFYGPPWSHEQRLAHLAFSADVEFDSYVYAPKDDPYHRRRWREPYPPHELALIAELASAADQVGVRFVYALHPALDMRFSDEDEHRTLAGKAEQLRSAGVGSFALLFDDVPYGLTDPQDVARFGAGAAASGAAHGYTVLRFAEQVMAAHAVMEPLLACPTDYAGTAASPYRDGFAGSAPADVLVAWTGADVLVAEVTRPDIDRAAASYRRRVVLWDNFPVNDFDPSRLFLGPLTGRTTDVVGAALAGVLANPMIEAAPSRFALATVATWARDPGGYDPAAAARAALTRVAGSGARELAPLVRVCSAWPPGADQDPELSRACADGLNGDNAALDVITARLRELAHCCSVAREPAQLVAELRPWLTAAVATAEAGLAAVELLRAFAAEADITSHRRQTRLALDHAEYRYQNVLRPIVAPFVRAALDRTAPELSADAADRRVAVVVTGARESAGDRAMSELLEHTGFAVRRTDNPSIASIAGGHLVVVTSSSGHDGAAVLAAAPVPVVAWGGLVELGLARSCSVTMFPGRLHLEDPRHPLAAGYSDSVQAFRGPCWYTAAEVGPGAHVVASGPDGAGAALFSYSAGDRLVDGTAAPAARIGLFLGPAGPAPWLLTDDGRTLVGAALAYAVGYHSAST